MSEGEDVTVFGVSKGMEEEIDELIENVGEKRSM